MSWAYWGIVIGLAALVTMLIMCVRLLAPNSTADRQESEDGIGGSVDMNPEPPTIHRLAA